MIVTQEVDRYNGLYLSEVLRPKVIRQQPSHRRLPHLPLSIHYPHRRIPIGRDELHEYLPARAAGGHAVIGADGQGDDAPRTLSHHPADGVALGADGQPVGGVLNVNAGE